MYIRKENQILNKTYGLQFLCGHKITNIERHQFLSIYPAASGTVHSDQEADDSSRTYHHRPLEAGLPLQLFILIRFHAIFLRTGSGIAGMNRTIKLDTFLKSSARLMFTKSKSRKVEKSKSEA